MSRTLIIALLWFILFPGSVISIDQDDFTTIPEERARQPGLVKKHTYLYPVKTEIKNFGKRNCPQSWLYNYNDDDPEYYLSGGTEGDQFGVWFQAPASASVCSLVAVELKFFEATGGGTVNLQIYPVGTVSPDTVPNGDSIAVDAIFNEEGGFIPGGIEIEFEATGDWERFVLSDYGYEADVGTDIFWIVWEKTGDSPMILGDGDNPGDYLHTWTYEPVQDGDTAWSHYGTSA